MAEEYYNPEDLRKASIAELNLIEMLKNVARLAEDTYTEVNDIVVSFLNKQLDIAKTRYVKARHMKNQTEELKDKAMEYLVRVSTSLLYKDAYRYVLIDLDKMSQNLDAIAYRLYLLADRGYTVDEGVAVDIRSFMDKIREQLSVLTTAIEMLGINPKKSLEEAERIIRMEEDADQSYRELELKIFEEYAENLPLLLVLKEIVDLLEETSDMARDAADNLKYIALHKV